MNLPISVFDHIFDISVMNDPNGSIITAIDFVDNCLVSLEQSIAEEVEEFYTLKGHFHHNFKLEPKASD